VRPRKQPPREREDAFEVDAVERGRILAMASELGLEHGLHERTEQEAVVGADEVDRGPHQRSPDGAAIQEPSRQCLGPEAFEPRPQPGVRIQGHLRLQPDQVLDGVQHAERRAAKQQLTLEGCPIQSPPAQHVVQSADSGEAHRRFASAGGSGSSPAARRIGLPETAPTARD
jgi:hypothetical protein